MGAARNIQESELRDILQVILEFGFTLNTIFTPLPRMKRLHVEMEEEGWSLDTQMRTLKNC